MVKYSGSVEAEARIIIITPEGKTTTIKPVHIKGSMNSFQVEKPTIPGIYLVYITTAGKSNFLGKIFIP